jgi:hypothetical protein
MESADSWLKGSLTASDRVVNILHSATSGYASDQQLVCKSIQLHDLLNRA